MRKFILFTFAALSIVATIGEAVEADDFGFVGSPAVTSHTQRFGRGFITRRSDGGTVVVQPFGKGVIVRESSPYGNGSSMHITQPFGTGFITQRIGDSQSYGLRSRTRTKERVNW